MEGSITFPHFRYPTKQQGIIWLKRRQKIRPAQIAEELKVSRPFVSKAQRIAEARIKKLLQHAAVTTRIQLRHLSAYYGIAEGYSPAHQSEVYLVYSPKLGVQTWFVHKGECGSCTQLSECTKTLHQLATEWEIQVLKDSPPTDIALQLFTTIKRRLKWNTQKDQ